MIENFLIKVLARICGLLSVIVYDNDFSNKLSNKECYTLISCAYELYNILLNRLDRNTLAYVKNTIDRLFDELNNRGNL